MVEKIGQDEDAAKKVTCRHCGAILKYYPREVKTESGTDYGGGPDGMEWVDCPECADRAVIRSW